MIDGGHTIIKCSACEMELVDIFHTNPDLDCEITVQAYCPCGDHSFPQKIKGLFHYGPPMKVVDETERVELYFEDVQQYPDKFIFVVKRLTAEGT